LQFKDKVVIITGASSGIGFACAQVFGKEGAKLVMFARNVDKLESAADEIKALGAEVLTVIGDVSNEKDGKNLVETTIEQFGRIDILINNAGISMRALFKDVEIDVIKQIMDINFWGTVYCTKYALPHILESKGSVVAVSSIAGFRGLPGRSGYCASKAAIHAFMETLRTENLRKGVHFLLACPGFTSSNIRNTALSQDGSVQSENPLDENKLMSAEEVAIKIMKAIRYRKRDLILTSQGKLTVFFNKWLPGWMDGRVYEHYLKEKNSLLR